MNLTRFLKKGERIMLYCTILFLFFAFVFTYKQTLNPSYIKIKVPNITSVNYTFETKALTPNVSMIVQDCRNKSSTFYKTKCMADYAKQFIQPHDNESNPLHDLNRILTEPTNCIGFSNYYSQIVNMIGLSYTPIDIWYGNKGHRVGLVIGEDRYCFVNLYNYGCWEW